MEDVDEIGSEEDKNIAITIPVVEIKENILSLHKDWGESNNLISTAR